VSEKNVIAAPNGYLFVNGRGTMLIRQREKFQLYKLLIEDELKRCGCYTRKIKVRGFGNLNYLNIFYLRGLDPDLALVELRRLPRLCGYALVLRALETLEQRVEIGPAPVLAA
jgi:hypothetical protein